MIHHVINIFKLAYKMKAHGLYGPSPEARKFIIITRVC